MTRRGLLEANLDSKARCMLAARFHSHVGFGIGGFARLEVKPADHKLALRSWIWFMYSGCLGHVLNGLLLSLFGKWKVSLSSKQCGSCCQFHWSRSAQGLLTT